VLRFLYLLTLIRTTSVTYWISKSLCKVWLETYQGAMLIVLSRIAKVGIENIGWQRGWITWRRQHYCVLPNVCGLFIIYFLNFYSLLCSNFLYKAAYPNKKTLQTICDFPFFHVSRSFGYTTQPSCVVLVWQGYFMEHVWVFLRTY